jgi:hypothetical protein
LTSASPILLTRADGLGAEHEDTMGTMLEYHRVHQVVVFVVIDVSRSDGGARTAAQITPLSRT